MDSLTQIVLGAAVGEVVLGRKVGNKAILWGAIAGTIPDLDVLSRSLFDPLRANEIHRGITHSIFFSLVCAPLFARWKKWHQRSFLSVFVLLVFLVFIQGADTVSDQVMLGIGALATTGLILWKVRTTDDASVWDWTKLFWWTLFTHPLLDIHTSWGTQLFWPLPTRLAFNNIFVVDPLYTVPFLICVAIAMFHARHDPRRRRFNQLGIMLSTSYLALTLVLKFVAYREIEGSLERQHIRYHSFSTRPTPFNAILWTANVDAGDRYYIGYHSLLDKKPEVDLLPVPVRNGLLGKWAENDKVQRLMRLTDHNYVIRAAGDTLIFCDLRFGQIGDPGPDKRFVFSYRLIPNGDDLRVELIDPPRPTGKQFDELMGELFERVKGE